MKIELNMSVDDFNHLVKQYDKVFDPNKLNTIDKAIKIIKFKMGIN